MDHIKKVAQILNFLTVMVNLKGYKRDLYEGGIRVPMIAKWKGKIKEGTKHRPHFCILGCDAYIARLLDEKLSKNTGWYFIFTYPV